MVSASAFVHRPIFLFIKKIALQEISLIHPDKGLLSNFTTSNMEDSDFAYASGVRTPEFMDEPQEDTPKESGFINTPPQPTFISAPPLPLPQIPEKVIEVIKELKNQVRTERKDRKIEDRRRDLERFNIGNINTNGLNQTNLLMCAVAFALGYMIAKKSK